jgi:Methyltransferase domain
MKSLEKILTTYYSLDSATRAELAKRSSPIEDLCLLHMYAATNQAVDAIEIGSFKGLSGVFIASALSGCLHTVNINPREISIAQATAKLFAVTNINFYIGDSLQQLPDMLERSCDIGFAYIDGYHSYEYSMGEYKLISPRLNPLKSGIFIDDANTLHPDGKDDGGVPRMVKEVGATPINLLNGRIACKLYGGFTLI